MKREFAELEKVLRENGFGVETFASKLEAKEYLLSEIKNNESIGIGGSITVEEMDIYNSLKEKTDRLYWHWKQDVSDAINQARNSNIYITSTNALTMDGKLVNMDGNGNRVAAMINGHRDVYIIVGKNKICEDYDAARERIRNIAAPMNAKRLKLETPCVYTGVCSDCDSPERICKAEVIIHKKPGATNINIYLIDEELGY